MHLFASLERNIRVDGRIRGQQRGFQDHAFFAQTASATHAFVRFDQWIECWVNSAVDAKQQPSKKLLKQLKCQFRDERNPLMHNDQAAILPFTLAARKLRSSLSVMQQLSFDFPLER
jgi:hypothetical protein